MAEYLKVPVSLSLSGSLVILVLLLCGPLLRGRVSRRWQYYVWLVAIFRLLLPLSPQASPIGALFREPEAPPAVQAASPYAAETVPARAETAPKPLPPPQPSVPPPDRAFDGIPPAEALALAWLGGALVLMVWKVSAYLHFLRCLRAGRREVSAPALLDLLARTGEELKVRRPVELWENPLAASPMLLGLVRPRIVLPSAAVSATDFRCTALHELTHYRRCDLLYKWLVQLTVCLHWWNPLVWVMAREIDRACELACDEAVLCRLKPEERLSYGDALLRALESGGGYRAARGSVSLGESAELLKERLSAIMNFKKPSRWTALLSLVLAAALTTGAAAAGAYTGPAKRGASPVKGTALPPLSAQASSSENLRLRSALLAERSYEEGDVAAFSIAVPFLSQEEQTAFLERAYEDGSSAFFSVLVNHLDWDEDTLDAWIARAAKENAALCSILLKALDRDEELEALEKELEAKRAEEYKAAGITKEGRVYYYQGHMVRIFLDSRPDASCVTLDTNPQGLLDLKVERGADGGIQSVREMDAAEVTELFGDLNAPEKEPDGISVTIPIDKTSMWGDSWWHLREYTLSEGDRIQYDVTAETGERMTVCFGDMEHSPEDVTYYSISNKRTNGELRCAADFVFDGEAVKPGSYRLFLHAPEGDLGNLKGSISLTLKQGNPPDLAANPDARAMTVEELPAAARKAMDQCAVRTWYVIHSEGRQYLYCNGFPWRYAWQPTWEDGSWRVNIHKLKKLDSGYVLLSFPDNAPLHVTLEGEAVRLTDIQT
ncbi:M56 family metallopeptidase [uncultured Oscillibacter sp.]|uniref:M56 family metallopeptidase n=1 Tax=uncultured Oscillibacter sp. TaxID=876091 RepID=UPI0026052DC1|nr:M56 family metallopeptidase [uncultured Oscillibacter sp.]